MYFERECMQYHTLGISFMEGMQVVPGRKQAPTDRTYGMYCAIIKNCNDN